MDLDSKPRAEHVRPEPRPTHLFDRRDLEFDPTAATLGPWGRNALHGGPVAGLLAHGILSLVDDAELHLARLTVDMPRAVPATTLTMTRNVLRTGRRLVLLQSRLDADGRSVAHATGLLIRPSGEPPGALPQEPASISPLNEATPADVPSEPVHHANCIGLRRARGGAYWLHIDIPLLRDQPLHPAERAAIAADWANPAANFVAGGISYINPDITLYLHRPPVGPWIGIGPSQRNSTAGVAVSDCPLTDAIGVAGRCVAAGMSAGATVNAPGR